MAAGAGIPNDGSGATLTLGTSTWETTALIISITPDAVTRAALETSVLSTTTARTFIPEDLLDNGTFEVEVLFHDFIVITTSTALIASAAETITITYPLVATQSTAALITGSGFCLEYTPPQAAVGELMKCKVKFKWAGTVTFTAST